MSRGKYKLISPKNNGNPVFTLITKDGQFAVPLGPMFMGQVL